MKKELNKKNWFGKTEGKYTSNCDHLCHYCWKEGHKAWANWRYEGKSYCDAHLEQEVGNLKAFLQKLIKNKSEH